MRRLATSSLAVMAIVGCLSAGAVSAVDKAGDQAAAAAAVNRRRAILASLGDEMDKLGPMVRNPAAFNAATARASAGSMTGLAARVPSAFSVDTRGFRVVTSAKDDIWQAYPDFLSKSKGLTLALSNLQRAAAGGERASVVAAIVQVGQSCRACHTIYKAD